MSCSYCTRVIVSTNSTWSNGPNLKGDKNWCGGCHDKAYISYPEMTEFYDGGSIRSVYRVKPEYLPSVPPWTTWSGTILCDENSKMGIDLKKMDPNCEPGFRFVDKKKVAVPGTLRGLYTS